MGYYTRYELNFDNGGDYDLGEAVVARIQEISGYTYLFNQEVKWYEHEADMKQLSKEYPDIAFTLDGEGEESGDVWRAYFKDGKMALHRAIIKFPEYNPDNLK